MNRRYLVTVALLAVLAVVFGLAGTVAPTPESVSPQQESSSTDPLTHFTNPPTFDSGWVDIRDQRGQYFNITHNLNTREVFVDIMGKQSPSAQGGEHQRNLGVTGIIPGWNRTYGVSGEDEAHSVVQATDGGYAVAGDRYQGGFDSWLVKTDAFGNMLWNQTYGGPGEDVIYSLVQTADGGYALAGYIYTANLYGFWLVKTDAWGNMQWNKTYDGGSTAYSVIQTADGGYALAGLTTSYGAIDADFWLVKTDSVGNIEWNKTYGGADGQIAYSVVQTADSGYAIAGQTFGIPGSWDVLLVKTDSSGNMQWSKTYGGTVEDYAYSVVQTNGGFALAGSTYSFGYGGGDFWLIKTDAAGNAQWNKTYGSPNDDEAYSMVQTSDGGYALAGYTISGLVNTDFWLVKTDANGNRQSSQSYGGTNRDEAYSIVQAADGGYALAGRTRSSGAGGWDFWLVKTDGETGLTGLAWTNLTNNTITLYRGRTDPYWNYVRVRIWIIKEPTWIYGDINMDGIVDVKDLYILSRNYGKPISLLSLSGIIAVAGIHTIKKRKQNA